MKRFLCGQRNIGKLAGLEDLQSLINAYVNWRFKFFLYAACMHPRYPGNDMLRVTGRVLPLVRGGNLLRLCPCFSLLPHQSVIAREEFLRSFEKSLRFLTLLWIVRLCSYQLLISLWRTLLQLTCGNNLKVISRFLAYSLLRRFINIKHPEHYQSWSFRGWARVKRFGAPEGSWPRSMNIRDDLEFRSLPSVLLPKYTLLSAIDLMLTDDGHLYELYEYHYTRAYRDKPRYASGGIFPCGDPSRVKGNIESREAREIYFLFFSTDLDDHRTPTMKRATCQAPGNLWEREK